MTPRPVLNPRLGALVRSKREALDLSLRDLAVRCGVHFSMLGRIEQGQIKAPAPEILQAIAHALDADVQDFYALCGYTISDRLPSFSPYLRSKYGAMPDAAVAELEAYFEDIRKRYGFGEGGS